MSRVRIVGLSLAAAFSLASCGGSGSPGGPITPAGGGGAASASKPPVLVASNFSYDMKTLKKATFVGNATFQGYGFDVMLQPSNLSGLLAYAKAVSDPSSGSYRQFLTPEQIGKRFGAPASSVAATQKYLTSYGLKVATWPQNLMIHVSGSQSALAAAFSTSFGVYRLGTDTIIGPTKSPTVPANLGMAGSPNIVSWPSRYLRPNIKSSSPLGGAVVGYAPQQVAAGFDYTGAYAAGYTGNGINVGVIGTGPIAVSGVDGITLGDVNATRALFGVTGTSSIVLPPVGNTAGGNAYSAGGFTTPPAVNNGSGCGPNGTNPNNGFPGSESPSAGCNPEDGETQIDTEQTALLAPNATIEYYLAYNPNDFCNASGTPGAGNPVAPATCAPGAGVPAQGLFESDAEIQQAIADNTADVLSLSFGESEIDVQNTPDVTPTLTYQQFETAEFAALAAEGIATFVSSGDYGAQNCQATGPIGSANDLCANYPATDPSVVGVGGVTIPLNGAGSLIGPIAAWGVQTSGGNSGSGGGISILFNTPTYQSGVNYYTPGGDVGLPMRGSPDVSLLGDPNTGVAVVTDADPSLGGYSTYTSIYGGTSVAAPEMAAMWSLVLQACAQTTSCASKGSGPRPFRMGNPDALLYKIYGSSTQYPATFYNVVYGTNSLLCDQSGAPACPTSSPTLLPGYTAGPGYNLVTGIGAPFARALIKTVVGV